MTNIKPTLLECAVKAFELGKERFSKASQEARAEGTYQRVEEIKRIIEKCPDHYFSNGTLYSGAIPENKED